MAEDNSTAKPSEGDSGKANRRRSFRSKRRARKFAAEPAPREQGTGPKNEAPLAPKLAAAKEGRERRRRRRSKQRGQSDSRPLPPYEDNVSDLPPLQPAFIYTHVIRPAARESYEFRSDHFSKATRRLEDFHIDLTPMLRAQEEALQPFKFVLSEELAAEWAADEEWDEETPDEEESAEPRSSAAKRSADDPEAAMREARRRRRARRAKAQRHRPPAHRPPDAV